MRIQCACGAKYDLEVAPEMAVNPIHFVCQNCGLDASDFVNNLIRQELASTAPAADPTPQTPALVAKPRLSVARPHAPAAPAVEASASADMPQFCRKHNQPATESCMICNKPICPKCMELFGYVCSPLCKARANSHGIEIPVYEGQTSVVEAQRWRKVGAISAVVAVVVVLFLGAWFWYAWFGSAPNAVFSVKFPEPVSSGQSRLCGKDQIVFLRGGSLARYDTKSRKEMWSSYLIDKQQVETTVAHEIKWMQAAIDKANNEAWDNVPKFPSREKLTVMVEESIAAGLQLRVRGSNIWVAGSDKLVRYDWDTGKAAQEISLTNDFGGVVAQGNELLMAGQGAEGQPTITHVDLATCESRVEDIGPPPAKAAVAGATHQKPAGIAGAAGRSGASGGGLPIGVPGTDADKPLDPSKVAEQAQSLSLPARIALPALLANSMSQERIMAELRDPRSRSKAGSDPDMNEHFMLMPGATGHVQFSVRLIESRMVARKGMKDAPAKSALDGDLTVTKTSEVANEILNEMQRARGGDIVLEDESRYQVKIRRPDIKDAPDWTGEVIGRPGLFPLKTVNVLTANKSLTVFDKLNKKLWQASLTYDVERGAGESEESERSYGAGPCVERGDTLYVFDQAVLTAFDLASGNVRWRLPSVGVLGMFFDDKGMLYVNTTTASPEALKFSRQIDINRKSSAIILKVDPRTGKILWSVMSGGFVSRVEGKFIFTVQSYGFGDRSNEDEGDSLTAIRQPKAYLRIRRLSPSDGRVLWEHFQPRAPLDIQFRGNSIQLVFQKEVQVLRFLSF